MNVNHIEGGIFMNYNKPELETLELEMVDVITLSNGGENKNDNGVPTINEVPSDWG